MEIQRNPILNLPPGFRFHPSDEELIVHYLRNKASSTPLPANIIAEVELYKLNPWELPKRAFFGDEEWYFFTPRDRKYPNGDRPNRMVASGYWKATGTDKPIFSSIGAQIIGVKKALVFYNGRPSKAIKSEWIMDEYRLLEKMVWTPKKKGSMRLDDWVLCRVRQKGGSISGFRADDDLSSLNLHPNLEIVSDSLLKSSPMLPFIIDSELSFPGLNIAFSKISNLSYEDYSTGENTVPSLKRQHVEKSQGESFLMTTKRFKNRVNEAEEVLPFSNDNMNMSLSANQWKPVLQFYELDSMAFA